MHNKDEIIKVSNVSYTYDRLKVLKDVNLTINRGDFLGLIGPNGSGKSTLIKLILQLLKLQQGEIMLFNEGINKFVNWEKIGYVSQKAASFNSGFPATVFEVVASGLTKKLGLFKRLKKDHYDEINDAIAAVDMLEFKQKNLGSLSGGQQQRVFIARALVSKPELLILDEPTVGIDIENVQTFYNLLASLNKQLKLTMLVVTHDLDSVINKLSHIAFLNKEIKYYGLAQEFSVQDYWQIKTVTTEDSLSNNGVNRMDQNDQ